MPEAKRILLVGTRFGRAYLSAIGDGHPRYRLAGILARGGEDSRGLADAYGVPYFTRVDAVPDGLADIACDVVRAGIVGGQGTALAEALLARGMSVLQEHPVHPKEIQRCQQLAAARGVHYRVNAFYPHLPVPARFIQAAGRRRQPATFLHIACSRQTLYAALAIIAAALGGLDDWTLADAPAPLPPGGSEPFPFDAVHARIGRIAASILVQRTLHPDDPDQHALITPRITLGDASGHLLMGSVYGPLSWSQAPYLPGYHRYGAWPPESEPHAALPTAHLIDTGVPPRWSELPDVVYPDAVVAALDGVAAGGGEGDLRTAELWSELMRVLGPGEACKLPSPPLPSPRPEGL